MPCQAIRKILTTLLCEVSRLLCVLLFAVDFSDCLLHDKEDPTVFLDSLRELLEKADPNLSIDTKEAILARKFLKGFPVVMRLKLLEHNPIPQLAEMLSFSKQFLAIRLVAENPPSPSLCAAIDASEPTSSLATQFPDVQELVTTVKDLQIQQKAIVAALQIKSRPPPSAHQGPKSLRCFLCKELEHIVRNCPFKLHSSSLKSPGHAAAPTKTPKPFVQKKQCTLCNGRGHSPQQCANNWTVPNYEGVPP